MELIEQILSAQVLLLNIPITKLMIITTTKVKIRGKFLKINSRDFNFSSSNTHQLNKTPDNNNFSSSLNKTPIGDGPRMRGGYTFK